jgi:hypothetical protein
MRTAVDVTSSNHRTRMWKQWINALAGLATIAVPFLGLTTTALAWTLVVLGIVVLGLSLWTLGELPSDEYERVVHRHA